MLFVRALDDVPVGNHRGGRPARGLSRAGDLRRRLALGLAGTGASALPHGAAEARGSEREGARGLGCLEPPERRPLVHGGRPELSQARRPRQRDVGAARHDALDQAGHAHVRRGQARPRRQGARAQGVAQRADRQDRRARHRAGEADHVHLARPTARTRRAGSPTRSRRATARPRYTSTSSARSSAVTPARTRSASSLSGKSAER